MSEEKKIYKAMSNVYSKVDAIKKDQMNKIQGFKFRGIDDVFNSLHKIFSEEEIFVLPTVLDSKREQIESKTGSKGYSVVSKIKYTFYAVDGSFVESVVEGEGADYGDKATSKSQSMAIKYLLLHSFMIPTEDMEDGDKTVIDDIKMPILSMDTYISKGKSPATMFPSEIKVLKGFTAESVEICFKTRLIHGINAYKAIVGYNEDETKLKFKELTGFESIIDMNIVEIERVYEALKIEAKAVKK